MENSFQKYGYAQEHIGVHYEKSKIVITSPDGITWTERTLPIGGLWYAYTFWNNMFFAYNYSLYNGVNYYANGAYVYSLDGINWNYGYLSNKLQTGTIATDGKSFILIQTVNNAIKVESFQPLYIPYLPEPSGFEYWMVAQ